MAGASPCPQRDELQRYLLGRLAEAEAEPIRGHLAGCVACLDTLQNLEARDTLVEAMRAQGKASERSEDGVVESLVGRLGRLQPPIMHGGLETQAYDSDTQPPRADKADGESQPAVPGYEILGVLGRGGMGVVYQARHVALKRIVALKMISAGRHAGAEHLARFKTEVESVARLQHPHIVQIYEVSEAGGQPYCALEYVGGGSLANKLGGTPLPPEQAAATVETLARAMQVAHDVGVIHRDLKPANVLLAAEGTPKIADFGLARNLDEAGQTQTGAIMGTPSYMAPEQAAARQADIGPAADVYALGAILYECITGRPPFRAATVLDTLDQVRTQEPLAPSQLQPKLPRDLETICLKCLQKSPAKRYAAASALADDLQRFREGRPITARPVGRLERSWRWCRRNPAAAIAALALLAVAIVSVIFAVNESLNAERLEWEQGQTKLANEQLMETVRQKNQALDDVKLRSSRLARSFLDISMREYQRRNLAESLNWMLLACEEAPAEDPLRVSYRRLLAAHARDAERLLVHEGFVLAAAFSPDGRKMITGGDTAWLWEAPSGKPLMELRHEGPVMAVAFSADGETVLTGSADKTARLWEARTGKLIGEPLRHEGGVFAVAFSPDGQSVLTGDELTPKKADHVVRLWQRATGKPLGEPMRHANVVRVVAFSPDSQTILTCCVDGKARLWEAPSGKLRAELLHGDAYAAAFSPDGQAFATAAGPTARLWETRTGKLLAELPHGPPGVDCLAFHPDGQMLLTGGQDQNARLWDLRTGKQLGDPLKHEDMVVAVAFSPDGGTVLTADRNKAVHFWDTARVKKGKDEDEDEDKAVEPLRPEGGLDRAAFSPDGQTVMTVYHNIVRLWKRPSSKPSQRESMAVMRVAFSPDRELAATAHKDKTARLWHTRTGKPTGVTLRHDGNILRMAFSPDGRTILTGSADKTARFWDTDTGKPIGDPLRPEGGVFFVAFSPDGTTILTASARKIVQLWDARTRQPIGEPLRHDDDLYAMAFSPGSQVVVTGCKDKSARLWHARTGKPLGEPLRHRGTISAAAFSPDSKTVLTGSEDHTAQLWHTDTGKPLGPPLRHDAYLRAVAFSPDGKTILTGGDDDTARLWESASGKPLGEPLRHSGSVHFVAFSPDGQCILTGCDDGVAQLWDARTGKPLGTPFRHWNAVSAVAFTPDGQHALVSSFESVKRWPVAQPVPNLHEPTARERVRAWVHVRTGKMFDDRGVLRPLSQAEWLKAWQDLERLGGDWNHD